MILDTSALVAVVFQEPDYERVIDQLLASPRTGIGTPTLVETGIVLAARLERDSRALLLGLLEEFQIIEVPFGDVHWREAIAAYRRYGRGRHRANLNFGDCLSYAVARVAGESLCYVGNDFAATDLESP